MSRTKKSNNTFVERVLAVVRRIPQGRVATYGQVASAAGSPRAARTVGTILRYSHQALPWYRVVNQDGRISIIHHTFTPEMQARLLRKDGVQAERQDNAYRVDLKRYLWNPDIVLRV